LKALLDLGQLSLAAGVPAAGQGRLDTHKDQSGQKADDGDGHHDLDQSEAFLELFPYFFDQFLKDHERYNLI